MRHVAQVLAAHELRDQVRPTADLSDVIDRHHVGVVQPRERPGFAQETNAELARVAIARGDHLERDLAVEHPIVREVDLAHATATQARAHFVAVVPPESWHLLGAELEAVPHVLEPHLHAERQLRRGPGLVRHVERIGWAVSPSQPEGLGRFLGHRSHVGSAVRGVRCGAMRLVTQLHGMTSSRASTPGIALLIGMAGLRTTTPLEGVTRDLARIAKLLPRGYELRVLVGEEAVRATIVSSLEAVVADADGRPVVIYVSGHATLVEYRRQVHGLLVTNDHPRADGSMGGVLQVEITAAMARLTRGGSPVTMIAEKGAAMVLEDAR